MNQRAATPTYTFPFRLANLVAFMLIVLPIVDVLAGVIPYHLGTLSWRVATIGLLSGAALLPMLGFFIAFTAAHALERRTLYRFLSVLSASYGMVLLVAAVVFLFDAVQLRPQISAETKQAYDIAGVKSLITQLLQAVVFFAMTLTSFRLGRSVARRESEQRRALGEPVPSH
jgi:hypothetical protein